MAAIKAKQLDTSGIVQRDAAPVLAADLDVANKKIKTTSTDANIKLEPNGSGLIEIMGASGNDGTLQLNCSDNSHGVKIKSPPHSKAASYTLILPEDIGTDGQVLKTDGVDELSWVDLPTTATTSDEGLVELADNTEAGAASATNRVLTPSNISSIKLNSLGAPDGGIDLSSQKITNLASPTGDNDAANKSYVDATVQGLSVKSSVRAATTANGTLSTSFSNGKTIDGVTLATGDRILLKDQSTASENGIYTVNASGAPIRATDFDASTEIDKAPFFFVEEGTANADSGFVLTTDGTITIGSTPLSFTQFSGAGQISAGDGLAKSGTTLSADRKANGGIVIEQTKLALDLGASQITGTLAISDGGTGATTAAQARQNLGLGSAAQSDTTAFLSASGNIALGGDLNVNGNDIVSTSNGNITIAPDGSGHIALDGLKWPTGDGSQDQVLKTDGSGQLSFVDQAGGATSLSDLTDVSSTATPADGQILKYSSNAGEYIPSNRIYIPQEYEESSNLSIDNNDENKLFFLSEGNGSLETITLPLFSDIDNGAIFTINTANSTEIGSTQPNLTSRLVFNLHNTDRTSNDSSDAVYIWFNGHKNYQTTVSGGVRDSSDAYPESKAYFWRNGTPIYVIKASDGFRIYGQAAYSESALPNVIYLNSAGGYNFFYRNAWHINKNTSNSNKIALPDISGHELLHGLPDGTTCILSKGQLDAYATSYPEQTFTHTTSDIKSVRGGLTGSNSQVATLNNSTNLYEYKTKARQIKFLKRGNTWWIVEEIGGINSQSLLDRHTDGSYHILGDESSTSGGLKVYNEDNTYASYLKAPAAADLTANVDFVLPASEGSDGQLLKTDGNGNTSWVSPSSGGSRPTVTEVTGNTHTVPAPTSSSELEHIYKYTHSSGTVAVTLPTASGIEGFKLNLKRFGSGVVTITPASGEKINDDSNPITLDSDMDSWTLVSDNSNWMII